MKNLIILFFIFPSLIYAQNQRLSNNKEILNFLNKLNPNYQIQIPSDSLIKEILRCPKKENIMVWGFTDITNDGHDDLIVNLLMGWKIYPIVVVNWSPNLDSTNAEVYEFPNDPFQWCNYIQPNQIDQTKTIKYSRTRKFRVVDSIGQITYEDRFIEDNLIFRSGAFIEFNPEPSSKSISTIKFVSEGCFYRCAKFEMVIEDDGKVIFKPKKYWEKSKRKQIAQLENNELDLLIDLIQYLDIENLNENYEVTWNHQVTVSLEIELSDGSSKKITDYGMRGTLGLRHLYRILFKIIETNEW